MDPILVLYIGGGLSLLLLVVGVAMSLLGSGSVVEERLGRYAETGGVITTAGGDEAYADRDEPSALSDFFNRLGEGTDLFASISADLAQADIKLRPAEYLAAVVMASVLIGAIGVVLGGVIFGIASAIFGAFVPRIYVGQAKRRRLKMFDNQLGDMLNLMVNGLRAGFSTLQAMEAVSREMPSPIADEFRRVVQEMQLGITMEEALDHMLRRIHSDDLDLTITAINVQREVGGNLAEILDVISYTIRERVRIKGEIQTLTAQGRATAWVISSLPIALLGLLWLVNRPYFMQFFNPETRSCGIPILILAGIMVSSGFYVTQRIVDIDI